MPEVIECPSCGLEVVVDSLRHHLMSECVNVLTPRHVSGSSPLALASDSASAADLCASLSIPAKTHGGPLLQEAPAASRDGVGGCLSLSHPTCRSSTQPSLEPTVATGKGISLVEGRQTVTSQDPPQTHASQLPEGEAPPRQQFLNYDSLTEEQEAHLLASLPVHLREVYYAVDGLRHGPLLPFHVPQPSKGESVSDCVAPQAQPRRNNPHLTEEHKGLQELLREQVSQTRQLLETQQIIRRDIHAQWGAQREHLSTMSAQLAALKGIVEGTQQSWVTQSRTLEARMHAVEIQLAEILAGQQGSLLPRMHGPAPRAAIATSNPAEGGSQGADKRKMDAPRFSDIARTPAASMTRRTASPITSGLPVTPGPRSNSRSILSSRPGSPQVVPTFQQATAASLEAVIARLRDPPAAVVSQNVWPLSTHSPNSSPSVSSRYQATR